MKNNKISLLDVKRFSTPDKYTEKYKWSPRAKR